MARSRCDKEILFCSVAVIQNQVPFVFTTLVSAINLGSAHIGGGVNAIIAGWGGTGPAGPPWPNALQVLTTTTLTNADCRSRHTAVNAEYIFDQKICGFTQQGQGICQGIKLCNVSCTALNNNYFQAIPVADWSLEIR